MILGYARMSTTDRNLDGQRDALSKAGAGHLFVGTITGRHRPDLDRLLDQLRASDVVVVTKYDRLARSLRISTPPRLPGGWCSMFSPPLASSSGAGVRSARARVWRPRASGAGRGTATGALALAAGEGASHAG